jgi:hypothetical protein
MSWLRISLILQFVLASYFQAILWFRLGSWNDQSGKRLIELVHEGQAGPVLVFAFLMLLPLLLFALALWKQWLWLTWLSLIGYGTWAALQIQSWWIPWFFGPDQRALMNAKAFERTYKMFPSSPGHLAPDAMHFVLDVLLFTTVGTLAIGLLEATRKAAMSRKQSSVSV